uniref:Putative ribonuclease H-like domain-containing protein n=1 Tax=Tanacetum cinerariifolium TaxID=118510 RepID=A0A6L2KWM0_TANCI|nr:putative ribonuclease H-like domain-containing protein [Tanacetum cinerariifolium]
MRPFRYPITILNTKDHLGKFDGKADEGFFIGYLINSKAFRVFNSRTRIVKENMHVKFNENTPNIARSGLNWLFDIDVLTKSMNYKPIVAGNQSNGNASTKTCDDAGVVTVPGKDYILRPLWTADPPFSQSLKSSQDNVLKPSNDVGKKVNEVPRQENECKDQEEKDNVNSTNRVNDVSLTINAASNEVNVVGKKSSIKLPDDPDMPKLEDISIFKDSNEDVFGAEADLNNLESTFQVSPIPTTRIHEDHSLEQVIGDLHSAPQTRRMSKNLEEHGLVSTINQITNHKDLQNCLFAYFLSQEEPKKVIHALKNPSWIEAMQEELLQFKLQEVLILMNLPYSKRAIGTKCVFRNKKDERGIVIRNKARLVAQGHSQEEGIDSDEVFAPVARIEAIRLFLAYASFRDFVVYQMDVESAFFMERLKKSQDKYIAEILKKYGFSEVKNASTPMETQKPLLKDEDGEEVDVHMYRSMIGSLMYLTSLRPDIMFVMCACARYQVNPKVSHLHECKKQIVIANSITKAEYVVALSCCRQNAHCIKYALTLNPTIYTSCIEQFWATAMMKNINGEAQIHANVDGKKVIISQQTIRRNLQFRDERGVDCLPNEVIFEQLTLIGAKTTAWNEFSSTIASAVICLATNQKFNFSKYIFDSMVFGNMERVGKDFSRRVTPLFPTMMVQAQEEMGEGSASPIDPQHTPIIIPPSTSQPLSSGGGPRRQDTMGDTIAQTRSKNVSKFSNDPLVIGVNIPQSREDSLKLIELMELCTNLQNMVINLETKKITQALEIDSLKRRVKKLKKKKRSSTYGLKSLYKVGLSARVESSDDDQSLGEEDASKQGRIADLDADEGITLVHKTAEDQGRINDEWMFDTDVLDDEEVFAKSVDVSEQAKEIIVDKYIIDDITLAKALIEIRSAKPKANKVVTQELEQGTITTTTIITASATTVTTASTRPKAKGLVIHEQEDTPTPTVSVQQPSYVKVQDKGKAKMVEEPVNLNIKSKSDLMKNLLLSNKLKKKNNKKGLLEKKLNKLNRLQAEEQEQLIDAEKAKLFIGFLEIKRKFFAAKRAEEKRNNLSFKV